MSRGHRAPRPTRGLLERALRRYRRLEAQVAELEGQLRQLAAENDELLNRLAAARAHVGELRFALQLLAGADEQPPDQ